MGAKELPPVKVSALARQLGVCSQTVRNWIKQYDIQVYATPLKPEVLGHEPRKTQRRSWVIPFAEASKLIGIVRAR